MMYKDMFNLPNLQSYMLPKLWDKKIGPIFFNPIKSP
jgi:hypothetical protein